MAKREKRSRVFRFLIIGVAAGIVLLLILNKASKITSTDKFCMSCHVHPHAEQTWQRSTHYDNPSGVVVHCVECHLPPGGPYYYTEKIRTGARDVYGKLFKDISKIDWEAKSQLENAKKITYEASCIACHENLFPLTLSKEGEKAHLYYSQNKEELRCINCHITVGHYDESRMHAQNVDFGKGIEEEKTIYTEPGVIEGFADFTEYIPESSVKFEMVAIPGGTFMMGSPENEKYVKEDEGPVREVKISPFFMGKAEVSWDEYLAFFSQTGTEGRTAELESIMREREESGETDGITGPTPPWGDPSQGWGRSKRPAITMTHHAATVYCEWLSEITGKKYRLPTEAEWEYAARAGTSGPYFFGGNPKKYTNYRFWNKIFGADTSMIARYVNYKEISSSKTVAPSVMEPNPWGLVNMLGNVSEFCSDFYNPNAYEKYSGELIMDPRGPESGKEHVIRGGSYKSDAAETRCASRDKTQHDAWLKTDPQMPKSIWWYSDCIHVGFRVVCEYNEEETK